MMSGRWGEMDTPSLAPTTSSLVDNEALAMKSQTVQVKVPHLHQPSAQQKPHINPLQSELCRPDYTSLHTIDLLQHCRQLRTRMLSFQHQQDSSKGEDRLGQSRLPLLPPLPQMATPPKSSTSINVVTGIKARPGCPRLTLTDGSIDIDAGVARQLSRRAVATVCAHSGYDSGQDSSLETLTDVLQEFLSNTGKLLRVAVDREAHTGHTGFQDCLTQVFHEIGVGDRHNLIDFWKTRIKDYHTRILKQNEEMRDKYEEMQNPTFNLHSQDDKSPRVKEEPLSDASFQDPQSHPPDDATEIQSESSSSGAPSNQPLSLHSLSTMELDDSGTVPTVEPGEQGGEGLDDSTSEWYEGMKEEEEEEEGEDGENGDDMTTSTGGVKREIVSGDEAPHDVNIEDAIIGEAPVTSNLAGCHSLDVNTAPSPPEKKIQLNMPPRKKKKK